jgi:hypothetical protein
MIARSGGSLHVDGKRFTSAELAMVGRSLSEGASLTIGDSDGFTAAELAMIARSAGAGQIRLE